MNNEKIIPLLKARLGISSTIRDTYLTAIVDATVKELNDEKGINLVEDNPQHIMFVVDYACWKYQSRDSKDAMPRYIQYALHNLIIHSGGGKNDL